ncbi:MAG: glycosyltransferase family 2 protein [Candidatus Moraniibacteriota bacterium]
MDLSIIITNYKNPDLLRLCINSILDNVKNISYEIIVADSDTEEVTEMMMREDFPQVKFFPFFENVGFKKLVNTGIENSLGEYFLILNGDILVKENSIEKMLAYIKNDATLGMIGPKLLNFNGTPQDSCFRFYKPITIVYRRTVLGKLPFAKRHLDWFLMRDYDRKEPKDVDWLMGSSIMIPRQAFEKVGPMDDRFFMYMEDVDWCRRFWEKNLRVVYFPLAEMLHYHGKGSGKNGFFYSIFCNRLTWIHISSAMKYFLKYQGKKNPRMNNK